MKVQLRPGPKMQIRADKAQIEEVLINLVHNAVDAALETGGRVTIRWTEAGDHVEVLVRDEGPGIMNSANLFVPFFTTKPGGSGIGLALSRQIAEAHGGSLSLTNRRDRTGAEALLCLPRSEPGRQYRSA
jgi:two-component system nitrogen regulation sensor histidine kinase NtrY